MIIAPSELRALTDEHIAHPTDPALCWECGEPYPCRTVRALATLTDEVARRIWAERQLRAQRQDANQPNPQGRFLSEDSRSVARLTPAPRWADLSELQRLHWNTIAVRWIMRDRQPATISRLPAR